MAKRSIKVYLGYEDELVNERNQTLQNYTVNKIGGFPDWPPLENISFSNKCPLCALHRLLIVQCYAPLENSPYHRTLYVFACVSPNCWIQSESWICIRSQYIDKTLIDTSTIVELPTVETQTTWCSRSDDWDDNDNGDTANGNVMNLDNSPSPTNGIQRNSDDDESNSFEMESVEQALGNLQVYDAHNANMSPTQGAVGAIGVPVAAAELEGGDEPGLVTIDTPAVPTNDIETLLLQTAELPPDIRNRLVLGPMQFVPKFIFVEEEWRKSPAYDERTNELLNKYRNENEIESNIVGGDRVVGNGCDEESYEEATPLHGDRLFHAFITRLKTNPGQILRYTRDEPPLLGARLPSNACTPESPHTPSQCSRCGSRLICELQLVPAFADSLVLPAKATLNHLHFLSVLIFTCSQSCWQATDTIVQETVIFQPEVV